MPVSIEAEGEPLNRVGKTAGRETSSFHFHDFFHDAKRRRIGIFQPGDESAAGVPGDTLGDDAFLDQFIHAFSQSGSAAGDSFPAPAPAGICIGPLSHHALLYRLFCRKKCSQIGHRVICSSSPGDARARRQSAGAGASPGAIADTLYMRG